MAQFEDVRDVIDSLMRDRVDYAALHKLYGGTSETEQRRYSPAECTGIDKRVIMGDPDERLISTSYVERQNLTMRMGMRRSLASPTRSPRRSRTTRTRSRSTSCTTTFPALTRVSASGPPWRRPRGSSATPGRSPRSRSYSTKLPRPMGTSFSTEVAQEGDETVIFVRGEIDVATCERLRDAIEPHLGPRQSVVLDLSGVEFMDSSSLRVLEQARGKLTADGGSLILRNPSQAARLLLTAAQAQGLLDEDAIENPDPN